MSVFFDLLTNFFLKKINDFEVLSSLDVDFCLHMNKFVTIIIVFVVYCEFLLNQVFKDR